MKMKHIALAFSGALMVACAGDKNEVTDNTEGAVLAVRTSLDGQVNEVAIIEAGSPEQVQAAVESANWQSFDQFTEDEELSFVDVNSDGIPLIMEDANFGPRNRGPQTGPRARGPQGPQARHQSPRSTPRFRGHQAQSRKNWRPHRPSSRWQSQKSRWQRPQRPIWNFQRCSYRKIWFHGRCVLPYSHKYGSYTWQPRWGYKYRPVRQAQTSFYVRIYF